MTNNDVIELIRENCTATAPDFLGKLDFEAVKEYREEIRSPKVKNYVMAAAIYAAACLVLVLAIPLIIGGRAPVSPTPGTAPVVTDTNPASSGTEPVDDPVLKTINAANIDRIYNGADPENYPNSVTVEEVEKIIAAVRKAYDDYDAIVLTTGEVISTDAKKPDITKDDLPSLSEDDTVVEDYETYFSNLILAVRDAVIFRFPDESVYINKNVKMYPYPGLAILDLGSTEFDNAETVYNMMMESVDAVTEYICDLVYFGVTRLSYYDAALRESRYLFPIEEEFEVLLAIQAGQYGEQAVTETATVAPHETEPPIEPEPTGTTKVTAPEPPQEITTPKETKEPVTPPESPNLPSLLPRRPSPSRNPRSIQTPTSPTAQSGQLPRLSTAVSTPSPLTSRAISPAKRYALR